MKHAHPIVRGLLWCFATCSALSLTPSWAQAPAVTPSATFPAGKALSDRYIVVFKPGVDNPSEEARILMNGSGGTIHHTYTRVLKGFAATIPAAALNGIRNNPRVESVEPDRSLRLNQVTSPQTQATWGLDRVDQRLLPLNGQYAFAYNGTGVSAFIVDTGIRADHSDFGGRVAAGYTAIADGNGTSDCNGHGTHVAGTVGANTWGIAKNVTLIPVRVLDCAGSGAYSGVIAGLDWVAQSSRRPAVANLSLGGSQSSTLNAAVAGTVNSGVTVVVAAGNSNADACLSSPASEPSAITVGAIGSNDARASYSNYGSCVDLFAPGSNITSTWYTSTTATNILSGTSMATPHVSGIAALALQANPLASPTSVTKFILDNATAQVLSSLGSGSPNKLAYSLAAGAPGTSTTATVAVKSLSGASKKSGKNWQASVTVAVFNLATNAGVANATVSGSFSTGGSSSCVTGSTGSCSLSSGIIASTVTSTTFTVNQISGSNLSYDPTQNKATRLLIAK